MTPENGTQTSLSGPLPAANGQETQGLLKQGADVLAALDAFIRRSEERLEYRQEHGRTLSKAHRQQLTALRERFDALSGRLEAVLEPPPDGEALKAEFEGLRERLEGLSDDRCS